MTLLTTLRATLVRRWHTNPRMCHVVDPIGGHSERVALILKCFWPDTSIDLAWGALLHDLHESVLGDPPPAAKQRLNGAYERAAAEVDRQNGWAVNLTDTERTRLHFADRLDAYFIASENRAATNSEWNDVAEWLIYSAERMGIRDALRREVGL